MLSFASSLSLSPSLSLSLSLSQLIKMLRNASVGLYLKTPGAEIFRKTKSFGDNFISNTWGCGTLVQQGPLNTEGLEAIEHNKSHFKRRHLAEFLLLSRTGRVERGGNNSCLTAGPGLLHTGRSGSLSNHHNKPFQVWGWSHRSHWSSVRPLCT